MHSHYLLEVEATEHKVVVEFGKKRKGRLPRPWNLGKWVKEQVIDCLG